MAYETHVQRFPAALCVLIHISSGQPVREPDFFSITDGTPNDDNMSPSASLES